MVFAVKGHIDLSGPELIEGWLYWPNEAGSKPQLEMFLDGRRIGGCVADKLRPDLRDAGYGDGNCAFSFRVPSGTRVRNFGSVQIRVAGSVLYLLPDDNTAVGQAPVPAALRVG